jgi:hypothetical protein
MGWFYWTLVGFNAVVFAATTSVVVWLLFF